MNVYGVENPFIVALPNKKLCPNEDIVAINTTCSEMSPMDRLKNRPSHMVDSLIFYEKYIAHCLRQGVSWPQVLTLVTYLLLAYYRIRILI